MIWYHYSQLRQDAISHTCKSAGRFNTLRQRQNGRHFPEDNFKCISVNENVSILIKLSLKFVPKGPIHNNFPALISDNGLAPTRRQAIISTNDCKFIDASLCLNELTNHNDYTHNYNPRFNKVERGVYWFHLVCLSICGQNHVTGEFTPKRTVTRSFDVFVDLRLNKRLSKQSWGRQFETPSCSLYHHCNVI